MKFSRCFHSLLGLFCFVNCALPIGPTAARGAESTKTRQSPAWQPIPENGIITKPGRYCLTQDLQVDRSTGIRIDADQVTVDLCGHAVRYTGAPKEGTFGIAASVRKGVTIANGVVGGFWFNLHCSQNERLRIHDVHVDNIPYIGVNVAQSKDVVIADNAFDNFRYDLKKDKNSTYVIGINIGAEGALIANNRFTAQVKQGTAKDVNVETVFVLFSAEVTKNCLVTRNQMAANEVLPRSYGVWVATNAEASLVNNSIENMKYGACLASDASSLIYLNRFTALADAPVESFGIIATGAKDVLNLKNTFEGIRIPAMVPMKKNGDKVSGG